MDQKQNFADWKKKIIYCTVAGGLAYGFIGVRVYVRSLAAQTWAQSVFAKHRGANEQAPGGPLHQPIGPLLPSSLGGKPASPTSLCLRTRTAIARCTALPIAPHLVSSVIS